MKTRIIDILIFGLLIGLSNACVQGENDLNTEADIEAINALTDSYLSSANSRDLENFIQCFDEEAIRGEPGFQTIVGKDNIHERFKEIWGSNVYFKVFRFGENKLEVCENFAFEYVTVRLISWTENGDDTTQVDMKVLSIFKKQEDGDWKIYIDNINYNPVWSNDSIPDAFLEEPNPYY